MICDLEKASKSLCELDINYNFEGMGINVSWFRAMTLSGNWHIDRHMHSSFEFHFIIEGSCEVITDTYKFTVSKGDFYLTAPGVFHEQRSINEKPMVEYCLNCDLVCTSDCSKELLNVLNTLTNSPCCAYSDDCYISCSKLFEYALEQAYSENLGFYSSIKSIIPLILFNAADKMKQNKLYDIAVPRKNSSNKFRMSQIDRFINDNISTPISTAAIAAYMHLSQKQVCRIISWERNMSTKEYVNSIKLKRAKELLKNSNYHIKKISAALGFSSEYYFSQFFKNMEGYPPAIYRENILNG